MLYYKIMKRGWKRQYNFEEIKKVTCEELKINPNAFSSKSRKRELVDARKIYCKIVRENLKGTSIAIGESINKDHSSVLHLVKSCNELIEIDKRFRGKYLKVKSNLSL